MSEALTKLVNETTFKFVNFETRDHYSKAQANCEHALKVFIFDVWRCLHSTLRLDCLH